MKVLREHWRKAYPPVSIWLETMLRKGLSFSELKESVRKLSTYSENKGQCKIFVYELYAGAHVTDCVWLAQWCQRVLSKSHHTQDCPRIKKSLHCMIRINTWLFGLFFCSILLASQLKS